MLKKLLEHKPYTDNGIVYTFFNFKITNKTLVFEVNVEVPEGMGWNYYSIEYFAYNIINEKILFVDSSGMISTHIYRIILNGKTLRDNDYYLPKKLEDRLENIIKKIPDFTIPYEGFTAECIVDSKDGIYDIQNDDYQVVVNCGFKITKIILSVNNSNKKIVITSLPQEIAESLYSLLMEDSDTELEENRMLIEGHVYRDVFSEGFSMDKTEENYLSLYLIPQKICGKKIESYVGEYGDDKEYFEKLISKSVE